MVARSQQAKAIFETVMSLDHPTAEAVFEEVRKNLPKVSLGTVYRNLQRLVEDGDVVTRDLGGIARYDPNTTPHVHLHDAQTDRLIDVPMTPKLKQALAEIAEEHLLDSTDCIVELKGTLRS